MEERQARYRIGQKFKPLGKKSTHTVKDIYYTRNTRNELVSIRYVCDYLFCDQVVTDYDVPETTIDRAMQLDELEHI